ncbi:hypothetical protein JTB14_022071 [Gonioctena quinquepunctata]|nr:hypothetical protein JTB14_022071 [Gonioctena quinquepunctata]
MDEVNKNFILSDNESTEGISVDPSTSANLSVTSDSKRVLPSSPTPESEGELKKLVGAARKRLSRLLKSGIPYNYASKQILEEREQNQLQERIQTLSEQAGTSKRIHFSDDSSEATRTSGRKSDPVSLAEMTVIALARKSTKSAGPSAPKDRDAVIDYLSGISGVENKLGLSVITTIFKCLQANYQHAKAASYIGKRFTGESIDFAFLQEPLTENTDRVTGLSNISDFCTHDMVNIQLSSPEKNDTTNVIACSAHSVRQLLDYGKREQQHLITSSPQTYSIQHWNRPETSSGILRLKSHRLKRIQKLSPLKPDLLQLTVVTGKNIRTSSRCSNLFISL